MVSKGSYFPTNCAIWQLCLPFFLLLLFAARLQNCPVGWIAFGHSCYLFANVYEGSRSRAKERCKVRERGGGGKNQGLHNLL